MRKGYSNLPMVTVDGPDRIYEDRGILYEDGIITHVRDGGNIIPRYVFTSRSLSKTLLLLPEQPRDDWNVMGTSKPRIWKERVRVIEKGKRKVHVLPPRYLFDIY